MNLLYKPDWDMAKEHYIKWWAREDFGRCMISVKAPNDDAGSNSPPAYPEKVEDRWLDQDYLIKRMAHEHSSTYYGAEAFPVWNAGHPGWDFIAAYLGCPVDLLEETGWVWPIYEHGELTSYTEADMAISPTNKWYNFAREIHKLAARQAKGKSIPNIQAIGATGDVLAALRSSNVLLMDLIDCPDYVRQLEMHLMDVWIKVFDEFYGMTCDAAEGCTNFMGIWAPDKMYICANDFSYMISPAMYEQIFMDPLLKMIDHLKYSLYHVDGIGCFNHIDLLCSIKKLNGLQILPGAGKPSPLHFTKELKKVQAAGKNLHITIPADEVKDALEMLSSKGLYIETRCSSRQEADDLIQCVEKWSRWT